MRSRTGWERTPSIGRISPEHWVQVGGRPADPTPMALRVFVIALLAASLSGCWVLGELDESSKKIDKYRSTSAKEAAAERAAAAARPARPARKRQRIGDYFANQKNARTLTKGQLPGDIVNCKTSSGTQFMKQSECLHRGGTPGS